MGFKTQTVENRKSALNLSAVGTQSVKYFATG